MEKDHEVFHSDIFSAENRAFSKDAHLEEATEGNIIDELLFQTGNLNSEVCTKELEETKLKLKDPPDIEGILSIDKALIPATSHNVSVINSACQQILKEMENQLLAQLKKNRKEQEIVQHYIDSNGKSPYFENLKKPPLKIAGMPYFKDKVGFVPPPNEDVVRKNKNKKLLPVDFIESFPIWSPLDAERLTKAVCNSKKLRGSEIDWMKISVTDMGGKYSPAECKSKWIMNLKPDINRSRWSFKESRSLQNIAAKYNYENWDAIANELGTGRSGLQCCIQYQTRKCPSEGKWSKEEDVKLKNLVEKYRVKDFIPWTKVAWHFQHRSLRQCEERYAYHLGNIKKGTFTMEEDFVIVYLASKLKNFGEVAKFLPNRVATQVRARYEYLVQLSMPEFTKEEDELLGRLMIQYPKNWAKISEHFTNRSKVQCRRRWGLLQRGIKVENDFESGDEEETFPLSSEDNPNSSKCDAAMVKKNLHAFSKPIRIPKQHSEVYNKIIEHLQHCSKFLFGPRPRNVITSEESKQLLTKLKITMRNLSISEPPLTGNIDVSALVNHCEFDNEDINVLKGIKSEESLEQTTLNKKLIPPNLMTLVGLRTIFMIWYRMRSFSNSYEKPPETGIDPNDRILFGDAKKLFKTRMKALFAYPLLLSNIQRPDSMKPLYKPKVRKAVKPLSKLKRKRHAKNMFEAHRKKIEKSLSEKLSESNGKEAKESSLESNKGKRKRTRRSRNKEVSCDSESSPKKRRQNRRTVEGETSPTRRLSLLKMYSA